MSFSSSSLSRYRSQKGPPSSGGERGSYASSSSSSSSKAPILSILSNVVVGAVCFYLGNLVGMSSGMHHGGRQALDEVESIKADRDRLNEELSRLRQGLGTTKSLDTYYRTSTGNSLRFPSTISKLAHGAVLMDRDEFASHFDMGIPLDITTTENAQVLMLYNRPIALPNNRTLANAIKRNGPVPTASSVVEATQNCDFLNVVLTDFRQDRAQCWAIMGQYEAFHVQKFMRLPPDYYEKNGPGGAGELNRQYPLKLVNRGAQKNGRKSTKPPLREHTLEYWKTLAPYLERLPTVLSQLEPVARKVAGESNTVVVMVCNFGQSDLFFNFVCHARSRQLDLSHILMFATDMEMKQLAESLGIAVWYDEETFGDMPKEAARQYADVKFTKMMFAKVYCVQMLAMLPFDFLFQDVDLVWFRDPLQFFHNKSHPWYNFDVYFQDDGNHALFYAPYSANTGFYYVRHNDRTQYFFNSVLLSGDLILGTHSHQIALIALLNEHASMYGLTVKILSRDDDEFPGGYHYHNRKPYMKSYFAGKDVDPYIFHMSWTKSKLNKRMFMEQMGIWYLNDKCADKTLTQLGGSTDHCCLTEPNVKCHYRDKPSIIPCKDSNPIDKNRPSWWK